MDLLKTFDEYLTARYKPLETEFLKLVAQDLSAEISEIRKFCLQEWRLAISHANEIQRQENQICAYMSISLLNTSVILGEPTLQVDFYNAEWVYGEPWARHRMRADFLFRRWQDFKFAALDDRFYVRSKISRVEIKALFCGTLDKLIFLFTCYVKYFAARLEYYNEFDDLAKAENFYVTCGTYLDWQNRVFAIVPEIDLLNLDSNVDTTFRPVKKKIYRQKKFIGLNLRSCRFEDCIFDRFTFEHLNLADAFFLRCRFIATKFIGVKMAGCDFFECYFKNCEFQDSTSEPAETAADEYFAPMRMYHCFLLGVAVENCKFAQWTKLDYYERTEEVGK